jgi:protein ImuB
MEKRFVSIWFPYLITDWFTISKPALKGIAFVVSTSAHGRMIVTAANPLAEAKGIYKEMPLADARAIHPTLEVVNDKPGLVEKILQRIARWCIRFTPVAAVDPAIGIILDATGCPHLWGGDKQYLTEIVKRIQEKGFYVKAAMADTIGAAWAVAAFRKRSCVIHVHKHLEALETLPVEALRIEPAIAERLHKLGLHQIKDLLGMKQSTLRRRFGKELLVRIHQATGTEQEFLQPVHPIEPYQERLPCLEPIQRIEGIEIALQQLLETLCLKLRKEGKGIREVMLKCYRVDGKEQYASISTSAASANTTHLFKLFETKLCKIEPALGIELFILDANKVEDYSPVQEAFWKQAAGIHDPRISELIDRITGRVGMNAIYRYFPAEHYLPERSFQKTTSLKDIPSIAWRSERPRPIHLLPIPQRIEVTAPVPDYPPLNFRYKGNLHKIIKADGPERIEQEWWIHEGRHRDYYAVQDEAGCRYWLFRSGHYDAEKTYSWYLHGFFA